MKNAIPVVFILILIIGCASTIQSPQSEIYFLENRTDEDKFSLGVNSYIGLNTQQDIGNETSKRYEGDKTVEDVHAGRMQGIGISTSYLFYPKVSASLTIGTALGVDITT